MSDSKIKLATYEKADEFIRIGRRAVREAQQRSREKGVPNVYSINGILHYELPDGSLTTLEPSNGTTDHPPP